MRPVARHLIPCVLAAGLWGGVANAQPPLPPKEVSPVTVSPATAAPKLVTSFPGPGQAVAPGVLILTLTFDQKMLATGFAVSAPAGAEAPECLKTPRLLNDGKTFVLLCSTHPNKSYAVALNATPQAGFANTAEHRAEPASLAFTTNNDDGPRSVSEAMKAQKLKDIDMPVQDTPDLPALKTGR